VCQIAHIEIGRVSTAEKVHQIGGREQQMPGENLHR